MSAEHVIWHDLECGGYGTDLPLWEELAAEAGGPVLDLGSGSGRVAVHLARRDYPVVAVDRDPDLIAALDERAAGLPVETVVADVTGLELGRRFGLVIAPMQVFQLLDSEQRVAALERVAAHLSADGLVALTLVEAVPAAGDDSPPLPDAREEDAWIYSSLPLEPVFDEDGFIVRRLRQIVSPGGELTESVDEIRLHLLTAEAVAAEAAPAGLRLAGRREIPPTPDYAGSTVVFLRGEAR